MEEELNFRQEHLIIGEILAKYPLITEEENRVLDEWKQKNDNSQLFDSIIETKQVDLQRMVAILDGMEAVREKYLDAIPQAPVKKMHGHSNWKMYAAAAALIMLFISGAIWMNNRKHADVAKTEEKPLPVAHDAAPGKFKAKLRLADGSIIVLDSAVNKALAEQGGTIVVNEDGKLVYKNTNSKKEVLYNTLFTNKGETYLTQLSDGTKVWLNSQSSIHYPVAFNGDVRKVEITGEAYFEVAPSVGKNGKRPFIVEVNRMEVEVLGTHFNINSYSEEDAIKTTLLEGKVKVGSRQWAVGSGEKAKGKGQKAEEEQSIMLKPGEQAVLRRGQDETIAVKKDVDIDAEVAWRFGYFNFNNTDLKTMMRQLQRWYDVDVVYQGEIPDVQFLGEIPRELSLSQVLNVLQKQNIHFKMIGKKIIVTP
jgi:transmembrane sensor